MHNSLAEKIARLQSGETISHIGHGNSMSDRIPNKSVQTLEPITDPSKIRKGDAVFCKIRSGAILTHEVAGIRRNGDKLEFHIRRRKPTKRSNGWVSQDDIYGKVIAVNGNPYGKKR